MKTFTFLDGTNLNVNSEDYDLLREISGQLFSHVGKPLIDQIRKCLRIGFSGTIESVTHSTSPEANAVVSRLVLNQLLSSFHYQTTTVSKNS